MSEHPSRIISPGMTVLEKFKPGDRVAHITLGDGVVIHGAVDEIHVRYQRATGVYNSRWFELHPGWLFHRHTQRVSQ